MTLTSKDSVWPVLELFVSKGSYAHPSVMSLFQEVILINLLYLFSISVIPPVGRPNSPLETTYSRAIKNPYPHHIQCTSLKACLRETQPAYTNKACFS